MPILFLLAAALIGRVVHAQTPVPAAVAPAPAEVSAEDLETLAATLEDPAARQRLLTQIRALIAARTATAPPPVPPGARLLAFLAERTDKLASEVALVGTTLAGLPKAVLAGWPERADLAGPLARLAAVIAAGLAAAALTRRGLRRFRRTSPPPPGAGQLVLDMAPVAAFALGAYAVLAVIDAPPPVRLVTLALVNASILVRLVDAVGRRVLPGAAVPAARWLARVGLYGWFTLQAAFLLGLPGDSHQALLTLLGLVLAAMAVGLIVRARAPVRNWLAGRVATGLAEVWHLPAILFVLAACGVWLLDGDGGVAVLVRGTVVTALAVAAARWLVAGLGRLPPERFRRLLWPLTVAVWGMALVVALAAWGIDVAGWLATPAGRRLGGGALTIGLVLALAVAAWEAVKVLIERATASATADAGAATSSRVRTLVPLLRSAFLVLLVTMVVLTVLAEVGVNIAPLLAGAGVVGLAIGFGAQSLVKDVITGLFILVEDTIAVGDVVEVGQGHAGLVTAVSIRSIQLRDVSGAVHTIPFSAVTTVVNRTRTYAFAVFDIAVASHEDVDRVLQAVRDLGEVMRADPDWAAVIVAPIEVMGVESLADSAMVIRARLMTRAINQWDVGREFRRRLKKQFDALGIGMPRVSPQPGSSSGS